MQTTKSHVLVFLIPAVVLSVGLIAVAIHIEQSERQRYELLQEQFESDAALRFLVRDALAMRLQTHLGGFIQALATTDAEEITQTIKRAGNLLSSNYGSDPASEVIHFFVARVTPEQRVIIEHAYPRPELVGREISQHPMLRDFDFSGPSGRIDQIGFTASRRNDLLFTADSPVLVRRHLFRYPGAITPVIGIVKINLIELQSFIDLQLRGVGSLAQLEITQYDPISNSCLLRYQVNVGLLPCPEEPPEGAFNYLSEKNGLLSFISATPDYVAAFERQRPIFPIFELILVIAASAVSLWLAMFVRERLVKAEQAVSVYEGSLNSKDALTSAIHTIVADNLEHLGELAQRVKDAPETAETERRYLNIALSEMSQLRLSIDAKIMADRDEQQGQTINIENEAFSLDILAQKIESELKRAALSEGVEARVLLDESFKGVVTGSEYWIESALLAFINASLAFTDEGLIELSLWTESSLSGQRELFARIHDTGVEWSLHDPTIDHSAVTTLRLILKGLGATFSAQNVPRDGHQEHTIHFKSSEA